jgi:hypothetical protein
LVEKIKIFQLFRDAFVLHFACVKSKLKRFVTELHLKFLKGVKLALKNICLI